MGSGMSMFNALNPGMSCGPYNNPLTARRFHKIDSTAAIDAVSPKNLLKDHAEYKGKSESSASKKDDNSKIHHDKAKETEEGKGVNLQVETNKHNSFDNDDSDDEQRRNSDFEGYMYMKSPSFRHFCSGYHSDDSVHSRFKRTATIGKLEGTQNEKKIQVVEEDPSIVCTGEVCMRREPAGSSSTEVNKTRRRRRTASFGRAFGHKPPGYKNLMKVKDYYTSEPKKTHGDLNPYDHSK